MLSLLTPLGLRLRIFLFFCLLALAGLGLAAAGLYVGWSRADADLPVGPFIIVFGVWLLFDEHVSKPINKLSTDLRLQAHSGVSADRSIQQTGRYLGDLAPAASELTRAYGSSVTDNAASVARETQQLTLERAQLTSLLSEIPVATILINPAFEIVLYDSQAADILSGISPARLKAPLADYFDTSAMSQYLKQQAEDTCEHIFSLPDITRSSSFDARVKRNGAEGYMIFIALTPEQTVAIEPRPLVFDFDLFKTSETRHINNTPLSQLCYVPFDTETTGLSVEKDAIVQIGAVRVLNGKIVEGEIFDSYVNPGRAIPPSSTRVHHIRDEDVVNAPDIAAAGHAFSLFAKDAVLVAHNAPFDIGFLRKSQAQMGVEWNQPILDTVLLSAVVFGTTEEHSLDALCDRLSITIPEQHRHTAIGDAQATAQVLVKLLPLLSAKGFVTFGQLVRQTKQHGGLLHDLNA